MISDALLAERCRDYLGRIIGPVRAAARDHGYAITLHGSAARDIDLVAIPWTEEAVAPEQLAEAVRSVAASVMGCAYALPDDAKSFPLRKPHGRLGWAFQLGGGPYIDLSVLPRAVSPEEASKP